MSYTAGEVYHLYQQSNSYVPIFREAENYRFFHEKVRKHLLPVADVLCYCLMPDHFHFLIHVKKEGAADSISIKPQGDPVAGEQFQQGISHAIRIMLSSYTRAYNRRYKNRGTLFRARTNCKIVSTSAYRTSCFHYIHQNPVKDGLVAVAKQYPYSSAAAWTGERNCTLCDFAQGERLIGVTRGLAA
ncbi:MAG: hypothetical protein WA952_01760 [Lewinella sp.]